MGVWYREQFRGRLKTLRELKKVLELFGGEIRYGCSTLPECCLVLAKQTQEPYSECFGRIYSRMEDNEGEAFEKVYREEMKSCLDRLPVVREDKNLMLTVFTGENFADPEMQIRALERRLEELEVTIRSLETELNGKCRMAVGLGVMSGLLLVVVLV